MKEDPKHIRISEFNYPLPDERIAKFPLPVRDQSKLLLYRHGEVTEDIFTSLPDYLPANSLIIFNNTKVIQARLHFHKETGALIEVFCLEPIQPNDYVFSNERLKYYFKETIDGNTYRSDKECCMKDAVFGESGRYGRLNDILLSEGSEKEEKMKAYAQEDAIAAHMFEQY